MFLLVIRPFLVRQDMKFEYAKDFRIFCEILPEFLFLAVFLASRKLQTRKRSGLILRRLLVHFDRIFVFYCNFHRKIFAF